LFILNTNQNVHFLKNTHTIFIIFVLLQSCASLQKTKQNPTIGSLKLIGEYVTPHNSQFAGTTIGGLSGIDYNAAKDEYYLISDDRSAINPARYYTAKIYFNPSRIDSVVYTNVTTLLDNNSRPYPNTKQNPRNTPDPEAIRYNPVTEKLYWTSEGERIVREKDTILSNPSITIINREGTYLDTFLLPPNLFMHAFEKGPRQNGVLEGMSFSKDYKTLFVNVEEPLYEDGPRADLIENKAVVRIFSFDVASRKNIGQYAYTLDPVAYPSTPADAFKVNGIPDILAINQHQWLVVERSFSTGRLPCTIKIFIADMRDATNIINTASLKESPQVKQITKKLLLNMDALGVYVDNVEGITLGPKLPNGHSTLVLVADNNFSAFEKTQFFIFEIIP
jgi:hypothetical protein